MKKMTLSELKTYVKEQARKLYEEWDQSKEIDVFHQQQREDDARRKAIKEKTPIDKIIEFFQHFKIDTASLNSDILRKIYVVWEEEANYEGVSDIEEHEDGSIGVELDGIYGTHWTTFASHDEWRQYYENRILADARGEFEGLYKEYSMQAKASSGEFERGGNTFGNINPDVFKKLKDIK